MGRLVASALTFGVIALSGPSAAADDEPVPTPEDPGFAKYVLDRVDDVHRRSSSHALMGMHVKTKRWEREMSLEAWSLGEEYSLIRILSPKKERGTATLKADKDLFTYLSKTGRTIKVSGASMGGSWMGSHFTNDDLMKSSRLADDFNYEVRQGPTIYGDETWALVLNPKPKAVVVWGRVDVMVRRSDLLPLGMLFYDEDLIPVRKMEFFDYRKIGDEDVPMRIRMSPLDDEKAGEYTEVTYDDIEFDVGLKPSFFSLARLESL
jgi:hypothetical protein